MKKPKVLKDEVMCSGCWAIELKTMVVDWIYIKFNYLDAVNLCPECQYKYGDDFDKLSKAGL